MGDAAEQRVCERATLRRPVEVVVADGSVRPGVLINVSLGGVLVELPPGGADFARGQTLGLRLEPEADAAVYQCAVMRVGGDLLGLSLNRKLAAKFGLAVTRGMFSGHRANAAASGA